MIKNKKTNARVAWTTEGCRSNREGGSSCLALHIPHSKRGGASVAREKPPIATHN